MSKTIKLEDEVTKCGICGKLIFDEKDMAYDIEVGISCKSHYETEL